MASPVFSDTKNPPTTEQLMAALGGAGALWNALCHSVAAKYPPSSAAWKCYSAKSGWTLLLKQKTRTLVYLLPDEGFFSAAVGLGAKAVQRARAAALRPSTISAIDAARPYVEGRSVRLTVRKAADVDEIVALIAVKTFEDKPLRNRRES